MDLHDIQQHKNILDGDWSLYKQQFSPHEHGSRHCPCRQASAAGHSESLEQGDSGGAVTINNE